MAKINITPDEFTNFTKYILDISGISLDVGKEYLLETRLYPLLNRLGLSSYQELLNLAKTDYKKEIENEAMELIELLDIKGQEHKKASKISGGQQQRVAIARALINSPAIVMGDEPTGNLDSKNAENIFDLFRRFSKERGQTIIAVTHDDDFASNCDRIIELADGKIV
jgi:ABC-type lipoprotein export system ATPase subunit